MEWNLAVLKQPLPSSHLRFEHIMQLVLNVHSNIDYTPYLLYVRILPVQLYYYFICQYIIYQFLIKNRIFFYLVWWHEWFNVCTIIVLIHNMSTILLIVDNVKYRYSFSKRDYSNAYRLLREGCIIDLFEYFKCGLLILKAVIFGALLVPKFIFLLK